MLSPASNRPSSDWHQFPRAVRVLFARLCLFGAFAVTAPPGTQRPLRGATMAAMPRTGDTAPAAGFTALLRIREFRWLWLADAQSLLGDQLARVALSVLVYDRTGSGLVTAAVYALTFVQSASHGRDQSALHPDSSSCRDAVKIDHESAAEIEQIRRLGDGVPCWLHPGG